MPYDVLAVANYYLDKARAERVKLDPMKLNKLVILAHGWHLGLTGEPLIYDRTEAWPGGPTIPALWREFKEFNDRRIRRRAMTLDFDTFDETPYALVGPDGRGPDPQTVRILDRVWDLNKGFTRVQLGDMLNQPGTPWDQVATAAGTDRPRGQVIPDDLTRDYFRQVKARRSPARV